MTNAIVDAHADDPEFGYRFIADELEAAGHDVGERRVWRLCRDQRVWSATTKKGRRGSGKTPGPAVHDDLVQRVFTAPAPDWVWLTDITEHPAIEGKLYCCAVKDVFSNRIVGHATGERMTAALAVSALRSAIAGRRPHGTVVVHSDCGSQFRSRAYRATLKANGLTGSIGRVAAAGDCRDGVVLLAVAERTSSTADAAGAPAARSPTRSSSGSSTPTTAAAGNAPSALTPVAYELAFTPTRASTTTKQHDQSQPPSTEPAADPCASCTRIAMCTRFVTASLVRRRETCALTVASLMNRDAATSALDAPDPTAVATSRSRSVSDVRRWAAKRRRSVISSLPR